LSKCLAKDPDDRWQSARDLKTNLEWIAQGQDINASRGSSYNPWRERIAWILASVLLIILGFFAWSSYRTVLPRGDSARFSVYPPEATLFTGPFNLTVPSPQFALSPDGRTLTFVANSPGSDPLLWLRTMDQVTARPLSGTEGAALPFWSPDSQWIGFVLPT